MVCHVNNFGLYSLKTLEDLHFFLLRIHGSTKSSLKLNNFLWSLFFNQKKKNCGRWVVTWLDSPLTTVLLLKKKLRTMNHPGSSRIKIQGCVDTTRQLLFNNLSYWPQYSVLLLKKNWQWEPSRSAFSPIYMAKF